MRRPSLLVIALVAFAASGCASVDGDGSADPVPAAAPGGSASSGDPGIPGGWRWESFGGVLVGVPGDWGWADTGVYLHAWCIDGQYKKKPLVARPINATPAIGCGGKGTSIEEAGPMVAFEWAREPDGVAHEGDRTTVRLTGVEITVQAPRELRERVVATIHPVHIDPYGCPATHSVSAQPGFRPARPAAVTALRDVTAVSACKYAFGVTSPGGSLLSSVRLDGAAARQAIELVAQAPVGGGPDNPENCSPQVSHGDDIIVLRISSAAGATEMVLRYSGCTHNGFDDGVVVRRLTAAAVGPFIAGANAVIMHAGQDEKTQMLIPGR